MPSMMTIKLKSLVAAATLMLATFSSPILAQADLSTYKAFGERARLTKLMEDFMVGLLADDRTKTFFVDSNHRRIKAQLVDQFCQVLDGPCEYKGLAMKESHESLGIKRFHFNALVEVLQVAMDKNSVPFRAQNKLLAKLAPMYRDIESSKADEVKPAAQ